MENVVVYFWQEGGKYILANVIGGQTDFKGKRVLVNISGDYLDPERCFLSKDQCLEDYRRHHPEDHPPFDLMCMDPANPQLENRHILGSSVSCPACEIFRKQRQKAALEILPPPPPPKK